MNVMSVSIFTKSTRSGHCQWSAASFRCNAMQEAHATTKGARELLQLTPERCGNQRPHHPACKNQGCTSACAGHHHGPAPGLHSQGSAQVTLSPALLSPSNRQQPSHRRLQPCAHQRVYSWRNKRSEASPGSCVLSLLSAMISAVDFVQLSLEAYMDGSMCRDAQENGEYAHALWLCERCGSAVQAMPKLRVAAQLSHTISQLHEDTTARLTIALQATCLRLQA